MRETSTGGMKDERDRARRQRINRYKTTIILAFAVWVIVSILLCVGMLVKIIHMDHRIKQLSETVVATKTKKAVSAVAAAAAPAAAEIKKGQVVTLPDGVQLPPAEALPDGERRKVYLTFDDGPSPNTDKVLDILRDKGVKATFFTIGREGADAEARYRRVLAEGHTLAMHSYTHKYSVIYASIPAFAEDFERIYNYLIQVTGVAPKYFRFPGGTSNLVSKVDMKDLIRYMNEKGIRYFDWNVDSGDGQSHYTSADVLKNVLEGVSKYHTTVVLMHDAGDKGSTVEALSTLIDQIKAMDADILPIDDNTKPVQHIHADSVQ